MSVSFENKDLFHTEMTLCKEFIKQMGKKYYYVGPHDIFLIQSD